MNPKRLYREIEETKAGIQELTATLSEKENALFQMIETYKQSRESLKEYNSFQIIEDGILFNGPEIDDPKIRFISWKKLKKG